jgi:hypothetical protein
LKAAIEITFPSAKTESNFLQYDNNLALKTKSGAFTNVNKVKVAKYIAATYQADFKILDLDKRVTELITFISESNPTLHIIDN